MQLTSEKFIYLEELSCKQDSLKKDLFCFNQNQDISNPHQREKTFVLFSRRSKHIICSEFTVR